jgi:WD40 repeat protein
MTPSSRWCGSVATLLFAFAAAAGAQEPKLVIDPHGHQSLITDIAFTSDGKSIVSASVDATIRIWDIERDRPARAIWAPTGDGERGEIRAMALSPDDRIIAAGGAYVHEPYAIRLHDFKTGNVLQLLRGQESAVSALMFSADSKRLASSDWSGKVIVWDLTQSPPKELYRYDESSAVLGIAISSDSRFLATGQENHRFRLYDLKRRRTLIDENLSNEVWSLAFTPGEKSLVTATISGDIELWDIGRRQRVRSIAHVDDPVMNLLISPDGELLFTASGQGSREKLNRHHCRVLRMSDGQMVHDQLQDNSAIALAISRDGRLFASAGGNKKTIIISDRNGWKDIARLESDANTFFAVGFSKDGKRIAFGRTREDGPLNVLGPLESGFELMPDRPGAPLQFLDHIDPGDYVRSIDRVGTLRVRNRSSDLPAGEQYVTSDIWTEDGGRRLATFHRDSASGRLHHTFGLTADGAYVVGGSENGNFDLWDSRTGAHVRSFAGHRGDVFSFAVSPDGRLLVSGSSDQTVRLWNFQTGENLLTIFVGKNREWVAWLPNGMYAASIDGDRYIGWLLDRGANAPATYLYLDQFKNGFYRPDAVAKVLETGNVAAGIQKADAVRTANGGVVARPSILASLPPVIDVASPSSDASTVSSPALLLKASVRSDPANPEEPVTTVRVFLNGSLNATFAGDSSTVEVDLTLMLRVGENVIAVLAENRSAQSNPRRLWIRYDGRAVAPKLGDASRRGRQAEPAALIAALGPAVQTGEPVRPAVVIQSPLKKTLTVADAYLHIWWEAVRLGAPIRRVVVLRNGSEFGDSQSTSQESPSGEQELPLVEGNNEIIVRAFDANGVASPDAVLHVTYKPAPTVPRLFVLAVGMDRYQDPLLRLEFAHADAVAVAKALAQHGRSLFSQVIPIVVPDPSSKAPEVRDGTRMGILNAIAAMNAQAHDNDMRLVFLSGHGGAKDENDYFFFGFSHLDLTQARATDVSWREAFDELTSRHGSIVFVADTCRRASSGSYRRLLKDYRERDILMYLAAEDAHESLEGPQFDGHGAFTKALLEGLSGAADFNKNHVINSDELWVYLIDRVPKLTNNQQTPRLSRPDFGPIDLATY